MEALSVGDKGTRADPAGLLETSAHARGKGTAALPPIASLFFSLRPFFSALPAPRAPLPTVVFSPRRAGCAATRADKNPARRTAKGTSRAAPVIILPPKTRVRQSCADWERTFQFT